MAVGRRQEEEHGQARAPTKSGVDAVAHQQGAGMMVRSVAHRRVGVAPTPGQDGGTIHNEVAPTDETQMPRELHDDYQHHLVWRGARLRAAVPLLG
ncbi:MAG TPA: hypothetical protein VGS80_00020 [Ktedonobacterales bacterium]|nr:hypothetical protein [Ktedonobacterales bacterium]